MLKKIVNCVLKFLFGLKEEKSYLLNEPKNILIVRQHNQLGDLLSGAPLFRALKEKYPAAKITCIVSPQNADAVLKNRHINSVFIFDKKKLFSPKYFFSFLKILRKEYQLAIAPAVVSISFTSNLLARLSNSDVRIGPKSLDGKENLSAYLFDRRVDLDWRNQPDLHVAEKNLAIAKPFGIVTSDLKIEITFDKNDESAAEEFLRKNIDEDKNILIGLHTGAGKPPNRWAKERFVALIKWLRENYSAQIFLTASDADEMIINHIQRELNFHVPIFKNKTIPELAALINRSSLFITNDTGVMHVAGATNCKQISLFGPTNPFNWAPIGRNKIFIRKSDLIDDISLEDVIEHVKYLMEQND